MLHVVTQESEHELLLFTLIYSIANKLDDYIHCAYICDSLLISILLPDVTFVTSRLLLHLLC